MVLQTQSVQVVVERAGVASSSKDTAAAAKSVTSNKSVSPVPRPSLSAEAFSWLLSVQSQSALQIAAGIFVSCLFTFVRPISFPQSCVVPTLFLVVSVMSSPNNHLGTRINAATSLLGAMWVGALPAAVVVSLSKLSSSPAASTAIQAVLGAVVLSVLAVNRVGTHPPLLWSLGMVSCLSFGLVSLTTWKQQEIVQVWHVTGYVMLSAAVAAGVSVVVAAVVLPTLATDQVHHVISDVLQSAGTATSKNAARLFRPGPQHQYSAEKSVTTSSHTVAAAKADSAPVPDTTAAAAVLASQGVDQSDRVFLERVLSTPDRQNSIYSLSDAAAALVLDSSMSESDWLLMLQRNSDPDYVPATLCGGDSTERCPLPFTHVGSLRPKLAEVQNLLLPAAAVEPVWLRGPSCVTWGAGGANSIWFEASAWSKVVAALQLVITRLSALEAMIEDGPSLHESSAWNWSPDLLARLRLVYSQTATSLALMAHAVKQHGTGQSAASAAAQSEGTFCVLVGSFGAGWHQAKHDLTEIMKGQTERYWRSLLSAEPGSAVMMPSLTNVRHLMFAWLLTNSIITATEQLEKTLAAAVCSAPPHGVVIRMLGWLRPLWALISGQYLCVNWHKVLMVDLPAAVKQGSVGVSGCLSQPTCQAGIKYWLVLVLMYVATLTAMHFDPALAALTPTFGYVAAVLSMSERVEATVTKVTFWLGGTAAGGALGYLAMLHPAAATSPYALMAIMVAAAFVVGLVGHTRARVMITLTLMTLSALVLCQYNGVGAGRGEVAAARVLSVVSGVLVSVVLCNMILPWYTSSWAIQTMADVYGSSIQLLCELHARSFAIGASAAAASESSSSQKYPHLLHRPANSAAATADLAAGLTSAAIDAFPAAAVCNTVRDPGSPAALQSEIARPLIDVQVSVMRDSVAWRRGVLATPPIVPRLLKALQALVDRLAAVQLALTPPVVTGVMTGSHTVWFGVPLKDKMIHLYELLGLLTAAVAAAVQHPESKIHANAVKVLVKSIEQQRTSMYKQLTHLRKNVHAQALKQQQQLTEAVAACSAATQQLADGQQGQTEQTDNEAAVCTELRYHMSQYFGTTDDAVLYFGFQFALFKALDKAAAVAKVVLSDSCRTRNNKMSALV